MRVFVNLLTILFLLNSAGTPTWASNSHAHDDPHQESTSHPMQMECCNLDLAGLKDCALQCLSNCGVVNAIVSEEWQSSYAFLQANPPARPQLLYLTFAPPPETPPPSV